MAIVIVTVIVIAIGFVITIAIAIVIVCVCDFVCYFDIAVSVAAAVLCFVPTHLRVL